MQLIEVIKHTAKTVTYKNIADEYNAYNIQTTRIKESTSGEWIVVHSKPSPTTGQIRR